MKRLIDADAFRRVIDTYPPFDKATQDSSAMANFAKEMLLVALNNMPSIDAEPVRHGKWIWKGKEGDSRWMCSKCKCKEDVPTCNGVPDIWKYCPNCGRRMDEERKEEWTISNWR